MTARLGKSRERITKVIEAWFLTEPLLFAAWTMHDVVERSSIQTIRISGGTIQYNPDFVASLRQNDLQQVLTFEAMRILLGHPYSRRQPNAELSYSASNLSVQECLRTSLPIRRARDVLGDRSFDDQYFEFYYRELASRSNEDKEENQEQEPNEQPDHDDEPSNDDSDESPSEQESAANDLESYANPVQVGWENAADWDADDMLKDEIVAAIQEAAEGNHWGSIAGQARQRLLATLKPPLDYRSVLRSFRQNILSVQRRLTRMKPSRRYGFAQMGSRYDLTTKLLFAVDVSGSMTEREMRVGFSVANQFFKYGVESIDVVAFDTQIQGEPMTFRKAKQRIEITGRGGTDFGCVIDWIDQHNDYDGVVVFTDGQAPVPRMPRNRRTRILWLFQNQSAHASMSSGLRPLGRTAFLKV